jgi:hypothetical protein
MSIHILVVSEKAWDHIGDVSHETIESDFQYDIEKGRDIKFTHLKGGYVYQTLEKAAADGKPITHIILLNEFGRKDVRRSLLRDVSELQDKPQIFIIGEKFDDELQKDCTEKELGYIHPSLGAAWDLSDFILGKSTSIDEIHGWIPEKYLLHGPDGPEVRGEREVG